MKNKSQVEISNWLLGGIFILFIFGSSVFIILNTSAGINIEIKTRTNYLQSMSISNKLLSSTGCLSTGELGVLNYTLLEEKDGENLTCAYVPGLIYGVDVERFTDEKKWDFGIDFDDLGFDPGIKKKYYVSIKKDGTIEPGKLVMRFATTKQLPVLKMRKYATAAWVKGKYTGAILTPSGGILSPSEWVLEFKDKSICSDSGCVYTDFHFEDETLSFPSEKLAVLKFKKDGNKIKIEKRRVEDYEG